MPKLLENCGPVDNTINILQLPAYTLYGIEIRVPRQVSGDRNKLWDRFQRENIADEIPARADEKLIVAYHSYEGDHNAPCTCFLGCEVFDVACVPDGFFLREIPAGQYAEFHARGAMPLALKNTWQAIRNSKLRRSYTIDFEVHDPRSPEEVVVYVSAH